MAAVTPARSTGPPDAAEAIARPPVSTVPLSGLPIVRVVHGSWVLAIAGVIYLSAQISEHPALTAAIGLLAIAASATVVSGNALILGRRRPFSWWMLWKVLGWALLVHAIIAGTLIYGFIYDGITTGQLALPVLALAVLALDTAVMLAFSVDRYQAPDPPAIRATRADQD